MKAMTLYAHGQPLRQAKLPRPKPGVDEILCCLRDADSPAYATGLIKAKHLQALGEKEE